MNPRTEEEIDNLQQFAAETIAYGSTGDHSAVLGRKLGEICNGLNALMGPDNVLQVLRNAVSYVESVYEDYTEKHEAYLLTLDSMVSNACLPTLVEAEIVDV